MQDATRLFEIIEDVLDVIPRLEAEPLLERLHGVLRAGLGAAVPRDWAEYVAKMSDPERAADLRAVLLGALVVVDRATHDAALLRHAGRSRE